MNKKSNKNNGAQFWARTSENQTKQGQVSLIANRVMPAMVLNRMNGFPTGPSSWEKFPNFVKKFINE